LRYEQQFPLSPLALPDLKNLPDPEVLAQYAAVALFVQRVRAVRPHFTVTQANVRAIAEICTHLDGLPLPIELAAARMNMLSAQELLARLNHRLQVLSQGARDLPERQQTLYNTLQWSYGLLNAEEQRFFRWLSVFVGGCTYQAAESVYVRLDDTGESVFYLVSSLIDKSLLQLDRQGGNTEGEEESRLTMLETVREFAWECLSESGEVEAARQTHAMYYLTLAQELEAALDGPQQVDVLERLEREHDNLRAALEWFLEPGEENGASKHIRSEMALRMAGALRQLWLVRGYFNEGRNFLERALAHREGVEPIVEANALTTAGTLAFLQGDHDRAEALCTESAALFRQAGEPRGLAVALYQLGRVAWTRGNFTLARQLAEEALTHARASGHEGSIAWAIFRVARLAIEQGEYDRGCALLEENLALQRKLGNRRAVAAVLYQLAWGRFISQGELARVRSPLEEALALFKEVGEKEGIAFSLFLSGWLALIQNDIEAASSLLEEALALFREMGHREGIAWTLCIVGKVAFTQGSPTGARVLYEESITLARVLDQKELIAFGLEGLASVVATQEVVWAIRLWGLAAALRENANIPMFLIERASYEQALANARAFLGEKAFTTAWTQGRVMTLEQALTGQARMEVPDPALALQTHQTELQQTTSAVQPSIASTGLTAREIEVLRLLAQGLTSAQIAERLTVTPLTVNSHVRSIYTKLGVTTRAAATRYAIEQKLV
jgi:predicted ATPase/DNA-binding CsgD family transcriptional regulator